MKRDDAFTYLVSVSGAGTTSIEAKAWYIDGLSLYTFASYLNPFGVDTSSKRSIAFPYWEFLNALPNSVMQGMFTQSFMFPLAPKISVDGAGSLPSIQKTFFTTYMFGKLLADYGASVTRSINTSILVKWPANGTTEIIVP